MLRLRCMLGVFPTANKTGLSLYSLFLHTPPLYIMQQAPSGGALSAVRALCNYLGVLPY